MKGVPLENEIGFSEWNSSTFRVSALLQGKNLSVESKTSTVEESGRPNRLLEKDTSEKASREGQSSVPRPSAIPHR
jgi:hypothetical protein